MNTTLHRLNAEMHAHSHTVKSGHGIEMVKVHQDARSHDEVVDVWAPGHHLMQHSVYHRNADGSICKTWAQYDGKGHVKSRAVLDADTHGNTKRHDAMSHHNHAFRTEAADGAVLRRHEKRDDHGHPLRSTFDAWRPDGADVHRQWAVDAGLESEVNECQMDPVETRLSLVDTLA